MDTPTNTRKTPYFPAHAANSNKFVSETLQEQLIVLQHQQQKEMPIASGASGRVDVGVDTSKRWAPDGLKDQPVLHHYDSYLLQYQELKQIQNKTNSLQRTTDVPSGYLDGTKKDERQKTGGSKSLSSGGKTSKTSKLCVVL